MCGVFPTGAASSQFCWTGLDENSNRFDPSFA
jgi:hypothetical protein